MTKSDPNKNAILAIRAAESAIHVHSILASYGIMMAVDVITGIMGVKSGDLDKACLIEFCYRHGGLTSHNASRFAYECMGGSHTNRCGNCNWIGHNKNHCPN